MFARREGGDFHGLLQHVGLSEASGKNVEGSPVQKFYFYPWGLRGQPGDLYPEKRIRNRFQGH